MPRTRSSANRHIAQAALSTTSVLRTQSKKKLNSLDQAGGVSHDGVKVVGAVVVDEAEGDLDALRIDEI